MCLCTRNNITRRILHGSVKDSDYFIEQFLICQYLIDIPIVELPIGLFFFFGGGGTGNGHGKVMEC